MSSHAVGDRVQVREWARTDAKGIPRGTVVQVRGKDEYVVRVDDDPVSRSWGREDGTATWWLTLMEPAC